MRPHSGLLLSIIVLLFSAISSAAGSISVEHWRGHQVLRLTGDISPGLSLELSTKLDSADVWAHGARVLLLDSPGGYVGEALRISELIDRTPIHTVVPNYAKCASACGSIIFVAGRFRTVEPFGAIGQHSCSVNGVPDAGCNEDIANHAVEHGVSHGSIAAFVTASPPEDMIWFSREDIDGWGLSKYPGEEASGFEKSEPRVIRMLTGSMPPAQSAWRLDFLNDGFRAFLRPVSDAEREMQLNLFCYENLPGRLFLSMEISGPAEVIDKAATKASIATEEFGWTDNKPWIIQSDSTVTSVVTEVPSDRILPLLSSSERFMFQVDFLPPYDPMRADTFLSNSRKNLIFAANNCARGDYDLRGNPL